MFGGDWTEKKLGVLAKYLSAYTTALKKQPFRKIYIDAFAGTGYRELKDAGESAPLLASLAEEEPQSFLDGSARIALRTQPRFDDYVFIEKSPSRAAELKKIKSNPAYAEIASSIFIKCGDSNELLRNWCGDECWGKCRAVVFLDPFGMQVEWSTMEAIAGTKAIDLWVLFPLGMAVNRMLVNDLTKMHATWRDCLTKVFGNESWTQAFYESKKTDTLLGPAEETAKKTCNLKQIGTYYRNRLSKIFPIVAPNPAILCNSRGIPLFQLHFAAANPGRGGQIAVNIARHILKGI